MFFKTAVLEDFAEFKVTSDPWIPWKSWKSPEMVDTPEKVPEIPWRLGWTPNKYEKSPKRLVLSPKWFFWLYLQFWFLHFCLRWVIITIVYGFTHLYFPFSSDCADPGKQSLSKGFKGTWITISWHRNYPGGCQYKLLNCWYTSIRQWICVITKWLSIRNVHVVVSAVNSLQSFVLFVAISVLCDPASSAGFSGPP